MLPRNPNRLPWRRNEQMSLMDRCDICGSCKARAKRKRGDGNAQLWAEFVDAGDEKCDAKRATHHRVLIVHTLSETERKVADCLRDALYLDMLVVCEGVVLCCDAGVVDDGARVGGETRHRTAEMRVDLHDFLY